MLLIFIDEAEPIYFNPSNPAFGQANWDADLERWDALVAAKGPPDYAAVCRVAGNPNLDIIPPDRIFPPEISLLAVDRNPSAADMVALHEACRGDPGLPLPRRVLICIDDSGSMSRDTLLPGLEGFEQWLDNGGTFTPDPLVPLPPVPWREVLINEAWLSPACMLYEDYR
jgi:hypothetical protein